MMYTRFLPILLNCCVWHSMFGNGFLLWVFEQLRTCIPYSVLRFVIGVMKDFACPS
jgi:hypothetical protein